MGDGLEAVAFSAKVSSGPPHPTRTSAFFIQHPNPCPSPGPSPAQEPPNSPLSPPCTPPPLPTPASPGFSQQCPLPPSPPHTADTLLLTLLSRAPTQLPPHIPRSPPPPWCPLFPTCNTREKCGRRLSGHWEQAEEAAGASWRKGVP